MLKTFFSFSNRLPVLAIFGFAQITWNLFCKKVVIVSSLFLKYCPSKIRKQEQCLSNLYEIFCDKSWETTTFMRLTFSLYVQLYIII